MFKQIKNIIKAYKEEKKIKERKKQNKKIARKILKWQDEL